MKKTTSLFLIAAMIATVLFTSVSCGGRKYDGKQSRELYDAAMEYVSSVGASQVTVSRNNSVVLNGESVYNDLQSYTVTEETSSGGYSFSVVSSASSFVNSWYYADGTVHAYIDGAGYTADMDETTAKAYLKKLGLYGINPDSFEKLSGVKTSDGYELAFSGAAETDDAKTYLGAVSVSGIELELEEYSAALRLDSEKHPIDESIRIKGAYKVAGEKLNFDLTLNRTYNGGDDIRSAAHYPDGAEYIEADSLDEVYLFNNAFYNLTLSNFLSESSISVAIGQISGSSQSGDTNGDVYKEKGSYAQNVSADDFRFVNKIEYSDGKSTGSTTATSEIFYKDGALTTRSGVNSSTDSSNTPYNMLLMVTNIYGAYADTYDSMDDFEKTEDENGNIVYHYSVSDDGAVERGAEIAYTLYGGSAKNTLLNAVSTNIASNEFSLVIDPETKTVVSQSFVLDVTYKLESTVMRIQGIYSFDMNQYENGVTVDIPE